jgi:hypothetical protein
VVINTTTPYTHANTTYNARITKHIIRSLIFSQEAYANLLIMRSHRQSMRNSQDCPPVLARSPEHPRPETESVV